MTKTESLRAAIKTMAIETCQEWLQCEMSEGVRAAIPNTKNLIMVGTPEWIAKNLPGVEAMVAGSGNALHNAIMNLPCERTMSHFATRDYLIAYKEGHRDARHAAAELSLAATTQASTAQAERVPEGFVLMPKCLTPEMKQAGGHANSEWLNDNAPIGEARYAIPMESIYAALCAAAPAAPVHATSSTDAQAAAEVRDAALEEAALLVETNDLNTAEFNASEIRKLKRAGDTGEQADGGEHA